MPKLKEMAKHEKEQKRKQQDQRIISVTGEPETPIHTDNKNNIEFNSKRENSNPSNEIKKEEQVNEEENYSKSLIPDESFSSKNVFQKGKKRKRVDTTDSFNNTDVYQEYSRLLKKPTLHKENFSDTSHDITDIKEENENPEREEQTPEKHDILLNLADLNNDLMANSTALNQSPENNTTVNPMDILLTHSESFKSPRLKQNFELLSPIRYKSPKKPITPILPSSSLNEDCSDMTEIKTPSPSKSSHVKLNGPVASLKEAKVSFLDPESSVKKESPSFPPLKTYTPDMSFDDSQILTNMQSEIDIATSRIEEESEKAMDAYEAETRFILNKKKWQITFIGWLLSIFILFICYLYVDQRIRVGFCGFESNVPWLDIDSNKYPFIALFVNRFKPLIKVQCVPCPAHGHCSFNSSLRCLQDFAIYKPILWSFGGIIPTFNECTLDSAKLRLIQKIINTIIDMLAYKNASLKCGDAADAEVGMKWLQVVEHVDSKLDLQENNPDYDYIWSKVYASVIGLPDITFNNNGIIRSRSLSKLSIKCRLQKLIINIVYELRYYLIGVGFSLLVLGYIFYLIDQRQKKKEAIRELTSDVLKKLQQQSKGFRQKKVLKKYIGKVQLRDYFVPQLKMSTKNRDGIWKQVVEHVEMNNNVKAENIEVDGDIMRVWEWTLDVV